MQALKSSVGVKPAVSRKAVVVQAKTSSGRKTVSGSSTLSERTQSRRDYLKSLPGVTAPFDDGELNAGAA